MMARVCSLLSPVVILLMCCTGWAASLNVNLKSELKYRLDARIIKFQFRNGSDTVSGLPRTTIQIGGDEISNPSSVAITETIRRTATTSEFVVFRVPEPFTKMESSTVEPTTQFVHESGVRAVSLKDVQEKIGSLYQWNQSNSTRRKSITIVSQGQEFAGGREITLPPCSVCLVECLQDRVKDFRVDYTAYANVSAAQGTPPLPAEELRNNLPEGMKYIRDVDQHTVEVSVEGSMYVEFELGGLINLTCNHKPSPNCQVTNNLRSAAPYRETYKVTIGATPPNFYKASSQRHTIFSFVQNALALLVNTLG